MQSWSSHNTPMAGLVWTMVSMEGTVATVLISLSPPFEREKNNCWQSRDCVEHKTFDKAFLRKMEMYDQDALFTKYGLPIFD